MLTDDNIEIRDEERTRCEVWTRVMGYHRPVSAFNAGKQSEHRDRVMFCETPQGQGERSNAHAGQSAFEEERHLQAA
ncbi:MULTISPECIES: anaerobic ribonucleoside-triphosphate reductase [Thiorhodovibrio]|uniref:anaerobic ribonucleoside-triphosphate reductase n=1 Tax=Thiorhodovibrio TaxID=61593 RepID=UPI0019117B4B|nr:MULTISPECIES: anaerobic ribonucleoside-triphosphate reductase [Thiorhodovibrio]MBK5970999.1 hypothetical protein [Thiorhodovibrio winogradskyi]WPL10635.1 anaerobic ribonucleoside-triphosphate reductase [Thiorhodovibrio litoralis]